MYITQYIGRPIYIWESLNKFPDFFSYGHFYWEYTHETLVPFEVISSGCNALIVPFQQLLVLLCEHVNDLRHSLIHLLNCLITTASEFGEKTKVTWGKVWTIGRLRNCLDAHLGQIVCDKDGVFGLVHCPGGNATDRIWRVLASSDEISSWTPLKA